MTVKDGFARNYLLPQGKALRATEANRKRFERERAQLEARDLELKSEARAVTAKLDGKSFIIIRQAGDTGQLYGSVSTRDIATAVTEGGFSIERRQVMLDRPIKSLGLHEIRVSRFAKLELAIDSDTILTGDDAGAKEAIMALCADVGVRPVDGGPLSNSRYVEAFVAVLVSINFRYKAGVSYRITGLPS